MINTLSNGVSVEICEKDVVVTHLLFVFYVILVNQSNCYDTHWEENKYDYACNTEDK